MLPISSIMVPWRYDCDSRVGQSRHNNIRTTASGELIHLSLTPILPFGLVRPFWLIAHAVLALARAQCIDKDTCPDI